MTETTECYMMNELYYRMEKPNKSVGVLVRSFSRVRQSLQGDRLDKNGIVGDSLL